MKTNQQSILSGLLFSLMTRDLIMDKVGKAAAFIVQPQISQIQRQTLHSLHHPLFSTRAKTMPNEEEDPFTILEQSNWGNASVTTAYDNGFGPLTSQAIPSLLDKVGFPLSKKEEEGEKCYFLDVATGPGYVLSAAINRAEVEKEKGSSEIFYTGLDFSSSFLEMAKQSLEMNHHSNFIKDKVSFIEGDAQCMPFQDNTFDSIVCNFGILHLAKPDDFLAEAYRCLRPGGKIAFTVWALPPLTEGLQMIIDSVAEEGDANVDLPEGPPFFRFSDADESRSSLERVGFVNTGVLMVESMSWKNVKSGDELYNIFLEGTGRTRALLQGQTKEDTLKIKQALCRKFDAVDGRALRMPAVVSSGTKPYP